MIYNKKIELDILNASYWEHFKYGKDLALLYPPEHIKRIELQNLLNEMLSKINRIKNDINNRKL